MDVQSLTNDFIASHHSECCGCHACFNVCPTGAIQMQADGEGFLYPNIDEEKCIHCGRCGQVCQMMNSQKSLHGNSREVYACMNRNLQERLHSSSGGIFLLLAEQIIAEGGVVFGALFDENLQVVHGKGGTVNECLKFTGSKYVQSTVGATFREVKRQLYAGKKVLFSGTPCQIHGLKLFLGRGYENLFTIDVVCHGVPSPAVLKRYTQEIEEKHHGKIQAVHFRTKTSGWKRYSISLDFSNGTTFTQPHDESVYIKGFLNNLYLRPSCYQCKNREGNYFSDLTLADYWGVEIQDPDMDDDKGTSLVLIHTDQGRAMLDKITPTLRQKAIPLQWAIDHNSCIAQSVVMPRKRQNFFRDFSSGQVSFEKLVETYAESAGRHALIKKKLKMVLKKMHIWPAAKWLKDHCR